MSNHLTTIFREVEDCYNSLKERMDKAVCYVVACPFIDLEDKKRLYQRLLDEGYKLSMECVEDQYP